MPLKMKSIVGQAPGRHLLITGGVHGDEFEPMVAIRRLAEMVRPDTLRGTLTLIPVVNEPAFHRGARVAEDGLDLARSCPGRPDGAVTEQIAHALSEQIRSAEVYIDLHTGGTRLRVAPLTGYMLHPDPEVLERQRKMARAFGFPIVWGTDFRLNGRSISVARDANIPAIYAEYHGSAGFDPAGARAFVDGCLNVMASLSMIERTTTPSRVQHVVEDPRPSSGHMQICNPAPMAGFFEPAVPLGATVSVGDTLGTVVDVLGETCHTIRSTQNGIVVVLHTFASVHEGDSLAVIMEKP